jgi:hypothetical protein
MPKSTLTSTLQKQNTRYGKYARQEMFARSCRLCYNGIEDSN